MPEYYISCKDCTFTEGVLLGNFNSLLMYLRMKKCPRCDGNLERLPTSASFKIKDGTPKFGTPIHGGRSKQ